MLYELEQRCNLISWHWIRWRSIGICCLEKQIVGMFYLWFRCQEFSMSTTLFTAFTVNFCRRLNIFACCYSNTVKKYNQNNIHRLRVLIAFFFIHFHLQIKLINNIFIITNVYVTLSLSLSVLPHCVRNLEFENLNYFLLFKCLFWYLVFPFIQIVYVIRIY